MKPNVIPLTPQGHFAPQLHLKTVQFMPSLKTSSQSGFLLHLEHSHQFPDHCFFLFVFYTAFCDLGKETCVLMAVKIYVTKIYKHVSVGPVALYCWQQGHGFPTCFSRDEVTKEQPQMQAFHSGIFFLQLWRTKIGGNDFSCDMVAP